MRARSRPSTSPPRHVRAPAADETHTNTAHPSHPSVDPPATKSHGAVPTAPPAQLRMPSPRATATAARPPRSTRHYPRQRPPGREGARPRSPSLQRNVRNPPYELHTALNRCDSRIPPATGLPAATAGRGRRKQADGCAHSARRHRRCHTRRSTHASHHRCSELPGPPSLSSWLGHIVTGYSRVRPGEPKERARLSDWNGYAIRDSSANYGGRGIASLSRKSDCQQTWWAWPDGSIARVSTSTPRSCRGASAQGLSIRLSTSRGRSRPSNSWAESPSTSMRTAIRRSTCARHRRHAVAARVHTGALT